VRVTPGLPAALVIAARVGRLTDPGRAPFRPWARRSPDDVNPAPQDLSSRSCFLYAPHQMLALVPLRSALGRQALVAKGREFASILSPEDEVDASAPAAMSTWRQLAVCLHALDPRYWYPVSGKIPTFGLQEFAQFVQSFDPSETLEWLGLTADQLRSQTEYLRRIAGLIDVLGDFYDLVRQADPRRWESLSGPALIAMDLRRASEAIDTFVDDLHHAPDPPVLRISSEGFPPRLEEQRLRERNGSLDGSLLRLGLSPRPSLLIAVEGQTEERMIPRVFEFLGHRLRPEWIEIECFHGVAHELTLLAKYVTRPFLGRDYSRFVELDRPITRFLVLVDAEAASKGRSYITAADREKQRQTMLKQMLAEVPVRFHRDLRSSSAKLITIRTWNSKPFEFAHFTDSELADGIMSSHVVAWPPGGRLALLALLRRERRRKAVPGAPSPNVETAWKDWYGGSPPAEFSKPDFADAMWPVLENKIQNATEGRATVPPVLRNVRLAIRLAFELPRGSLGLQPSRRIR